MIIRFNSRSSVKLWLGGSVVSYNGGNVGEYSRCVCWGDYVFRCSVGRLESTYYCYNWHECENRSLLWGGGI